MGSARTPCGPCTRMVASNAAMATRMAVGIGALGGAVCEQLRIATADAGVIRLWAPLHDIGKIGIPESTLRRPGPLSAEEAPVMQRPPPIGARILEPVPHFAALVPLVRA